jgi:mRNA interferase RelE/StbE
VSEDAGSEASEDSWSVSFAKRADKDMDRLDPPVRQRVTDGIERLTDDEASTDVRKLKGSDELRLRVGDWRVRFRRDSEKRKIVVLRVLPRGRAYKR